MDAELEPSADLVTISCIGGGVDFRTRNQDLSVAVGGVAVYPLDELLHASWDDVAVENIRLPGAALNRVAHQNGAPPDSIIRFTGMAPVSAAAGAQWRVLTTYLRAQFEAPEPFIDNPLVQVATLDLIAGTALQVFPNSTLTAAYTAGPGHAGPTSLRVAIDYIHQHAADPITLADIAAAAGVTPRALQHAFRTHRETTPLLYLRDVRLLAAHRELLSADPAATRIADIATRWGFLNHSHFSHVYRQRYGRTPARTLHS
jgi:AraC-like DNA-binding protein